MKPTLYTDGGVCGKNPSRLGGTWAWCLVRDGEMVQWDSGIVTPDELYQETVSNNDSELLAAIKGLTYLMNLGGLRKLTDVEWWTDSNVTRCRMSTSPIDRVPVWALSTVHACRRYGFWKTVLTAGHPTRAEIASGWRLRNGLPTSPWNVWVDKECQRLAKKYITKTQGAKR